MTKVRIVKRTSINGDVSYVIQQKHFIFFWWWVDAGYNSLTECIDTFATLEKAKKYLCYFDGTKVKDEVIEEYKPTKVIKSKYAEVVVKGDYKKYSPPGPTGYPISLSDLPSKGNYGPSSISIGKIDEEAGIIYAPYILKEHDEESLQQYNEFMKWYKSQHKYCPICFSEQHSTTLMGFILNWEDKENYKDLNSCVCVTCGSKHTVHERISCDNRKSRCCGRCDGVSDLCVADTICDDHSIMGCEECFGPRNS